MSSLAFVAPGAAPSVRHVGHATLASSAAAPRPAAAAAAQGSLPCSGATLAAGLALGALAAAHAPAQRRSAAKGRAGRTAAVAMQARGGGVVCAGIVITGGAAGVGWAYAVEFCKLGHQVVICDIKDPEVAVNAIKEKVPGALIYGVACDVSKIEDVKNLCAFTKEKIGTVHHWINNAGINGGRRKFTEVPIEQVDAVLRVNLGGILLCTHAAMTMMEAQQGVTSHIYNTVGSGVKGGGTPGYVAYGSTKRGLPQMTESLVKEIEEGVQGYDKKETPGKVCCHVLSPGMVFTDLLLNDSTPELRKFPFGVLAAQPEEVAQDIVPKILNISGNGKSVEFLTTDRILTQFFKKFILGEKSQYIDDDGNVIQLPGAQYQDNGVRSLY
mmetsp:Transcript_102310/g.220864  ORF Transcript_102310/g.220864 Transcript_102310/m.220864 type:complete len:384 (-) Transcript_102310:169-1320(-)